MAVIAAIVAALAGPRLTATAQHTFTAHSAPLREVAFSPDGHLLATVILWAVQTSTGR